ncbi:tRNA lysidine(34) synthetase TilS [Primorskyibacter sp. S87]|uniref:tRNA lysidine(34) synthetase TilS n=1 Tax=Primorskyibacter sp. S87 TaxID=3415126 RepID=UPI003C7EB9D0
MQLSGCENRLLDDLRSRLPDPAPARIGIAVSGGSDSMALLHLMNRCFASGAVQVLAATVDHGLRPGAEEEARVVEQAARDLGISHVTLRWDKWDGRGNLQDQARKARYDLLTRWARSQRIDVLVMGHTMDDQAETVLMRLARSAGSGGLAGIPPKRVVDGVAVLRPLLGQTRADLRSYLKERGVGWIEDPSNDDTRFERVRVRQALPELARLGISADVLADVARNMQSTNDALAHYAAQEAKTHVGIEAGDLILNRDGLEAMPAEIARRLLDRAIRWVAGQEHPPRRDPLGKLFAEISAGRSRTLGGCRILVKGENVRVCREHGAILGMRCLVTDPWDDRWQFEAPPGNLLSNELTVAALGEAGVAQCAEWREFGRPYAAVLADPAVWHGDDLVAAPTLGKANGWQLKLLRGKEEFFASLLSH